MEGGEKKASFSSEVSKKAGVFGGCPVGVDKDISYFGRKMRREKVGQTLKLAGSAILPKLYLSISFDDRRTPDI